MKITVPINSLTQMRALIHAGAREFYCGMPPVDRTTVVNRQDTYLAGDDEARALIELAEKNNCRLFFALNMYYTPSIRRLILDQLEGFTNAGSFGLIVSDAALITLLRDRFPQAPLVASVLGHTLNSQAVRFYTQLGCTRVILGTHLSQIELEKLVAQNRTEGELEALVLNSGCYYEDGFCAFEHRVLKAIPRESAVKSFLYRTNQTLLDRGPRFVRRGFYALGPDYNPCCLRPGEIEILRNDKPRSRDMEKAALLLLNMERFKHKCGLCSLHGLQRAGLSACKLVGREKTRTEKQRDFLMVQQALAHLDQPVTFQDFRRYCQSLFKKRNGYHCNESFCYYAFQRSNPE